MSTVELRCNKNEYDNSNFYGERSFWLHANVGYGFFGTNIPDLELISTWNSHIGYEDSDIIITYTFKYPKDAIVFKLRWS